MQRAELGPGKLRRAGGQSGLWGWQESTKPYLELASVLKDWLPRIVQGRLGYCSSRGARGANLWGAKRMSGGREGGVAVPSWKRSALVLFSSHPKDQERVPT